jgi:hypothetical protein
MTPSVIPPSPGGGRSSREAWRDGVKARASALRIPASRAPHPAHLRCATLPLQGRVKKAISSSQRDPRRSLINGEARNRQTFSAIHHSPLAFFFPLQKRGGRTPQTQIQPPRLRARRALSGARTPVGVPPRRLPRTWQSSAQLQARLPGTWSSRALPARSCPSPVAAPHTPVVMPASMMPGAARERTANPPAGTAPTLPHGLPPGSVPWRVEF